MRVDRGVAMSRKVFCRRHCACRLCAFRERSRKSCDVRGVFAIRAHIDHGIRGVVVDVNNRREDLLHAESACFARGDLALATCEVRIASGADGHVPGKVDGIVETHAGSGFEVRGDEQRIARELLHPVREYHGLVNRTTKENDAADLGLFNVPFECAIGLRVLVEKRCIHADRNELTHLLFQRHLPQRFVGPLQRGGARVAFERGDLQRLGARLLRPHRRRRHCEHRQQ